MESFATKVNNFWPLTIVARLSFLDVILVSPLLTFNNSNFAVVLLLLHVKTRLSTRKAHSTSFLLAKLAWTCEEISKKVHGNKLELSYSKKNQLWCKCFLIFLPLTNKLQVIKWVKVFNGPSKICGRQPSKYLNGYGPLRQTTLVQIF